MSCPRHQIPNWLLAQSFNGGLFDEHKSSINVAYGEDKNSKLHKDLLKLFKTLGKNGFSWRIESQSHWTDNAESETIKALNKQIANLTEQMAKVSMVSDLPLTLIILLVHMTPVVSRVTVRVLVPKFMRRQMPCTVNLLVNHTLTDIM